MIYHMETNKQAEPGDLSNMPMVSPYNQDEKHGFIADINSAIKKNED